MNKSELNKGIAKAKGGINMTRAKAIKYLENAIKSKKLSWFEKQQLKQGALMLKHIDTKENKYFYKSKELGEKVHGLDYRDMYITIFNDYEKCLLVFVNDKGQTKSVNYDDNFFYVESLLDTYLDLIEDSFKYWEINDKETKKKYLTKYYKYLNAYGDIEEELISPRIKELLK